MTFNKKLLLLPAICISLMCGCGNNQENNHSRGNGESVLQGIPTGIKSKLVKSLLKLLARNGGTLTKGAHAKEGKYVIVILDKAGNILTRIHFNMPKSKFLEFSKLFGDFKKIRDNWMPYFNIDLLKN